MDDKKSTPTMQHGIGTKEVRFAPITRGEYRRYIGSGDIILDEPGYLVEYLDGSKANHPNHKGYISWSPQEVFDNAYRPTLCMTFGLAIEAMKRGYRVARTGWNGKGMFVLYCDEGPAYPITDGRVYARLPYIYMKTSDDKLVPWLASQTDMLADDWVVVS